MNKPNTIHITIPAPCSQSWELMASDGNGRFCDHCQKTVIDFTTYSDTALYNFFAKNKEQVCGRFLNIKLTKSLHIPYQPKSRLYRLTIAMGLTLLFAQTPALLAQVKPPLATQQVQEPKIKNSDPFGMMKGMIIDQALQPIPGVLVQVYKDGQYCIGTITGIDGRFSISPIDPGMYSIMSSHAGYDTLTDTCNVIAGQATLIAHKLSTAGTSATQNTADIIPQTIVMGGPMTYIDYDVLSLPTVSMRNKHRSKATVKPKAVKKSVAKK